MRIANVRLVSKVQNVKRVRIELNRNENEKLVSSFKVISHVQRLVFSLISKCSNTANTSNVSHREQVSRRLKVEEEKFSHRILFRLALRAIRRSCAKGLRYNMNLQRCTY